MDFCEILEKIAHHIEKNAEYLDELDAVMGDGEHGFNMKKCFNTVKLMICLWPVPVPPVCGGHGFLRWRARHR